VQRPCVSKRKVFLMSWVSPWTVFGFRKFLQSLILHRLKYFILSCFCANLTLFLIYHFNSIQVKDVFLPWYNAYRFLVQNAKRLEVEGLAPFTPIDAGTLQNSSNVLDQWINSATQSLVHFVHQEMNAYRLYTVSCF
jgi:isoleucyl-tRNA synthetase